MIRLAVFSSPIATARVKTIIGMVVSGRNIFCSSFRATIFAYPLAGRLGNLLHHFMFVAQIANLREATNLVRAMPCIFCLKQVMSFWFRGIFEFHKIGAIDRT